MNHHITQKISPAITKEINKPYKNIGVNDEQGTSHMVNIFSDFPDFANIKVGSIIRGKIEKNGQYENLVSEVQGRSRNNGFTAYKEAVIEKSMERKEQSIAKSRDNKDWSIKVSSTWRDAVTLATTEYKDKTVLDGLEQAVLKWRRFCWDNFDVDISDTDAITGKLNK